jgi:AraC-like DNA-binding protein
MTIEQPATQVFRHHSDTARWEMVRRAAHPLLRRHVREYVGYDEATATPMRRIEVPHDATVLILNFGPPLAIEGPDGGGRSTARYRSFFAGLHEAFVATETAGSQRGVQVNLTPLGAYRFLGRPQAELANRVVGLDDLFGAAADRFVERLQEIPGWADRFALIDDFLIRRVAMAAPVLPEVEAAWRRLRATHGNATIGAIAEDLGWSRKRLIERFRGQIGLTPKSAARLLRFHRATGLIGRHVDLGWAEIAYDCGYYDQAHFIRDFRQFAGRTPSAYRRSLLPDSGGVAGG